MIAKTSFHLDVKFMSVDDQRRFVNVYNGALAHVRHMPPVVRTRDEQHIPLSIWVGTYNLSNNKPPDELQPWLQTSGDDIVALAYQELQEFDEDIGDLADCQGVLRWLPIARLHEPIRGLQHAQPTRSG